MSPLPDQIARALGERKLWRRNANVILAVSGGADSMAMLHALAHAGPIGKFRVAHVHHGLRGRAAEADARLVENAARTLGLPFHLCRADVKVLAKRKQISIEMAAREARHTFFGKLAESYHAVIATAHTCDDQAETVLLRLLRGSSSEGLGGIDYKTKIHGITFVRPLLDIKHADAIAFLASRKLKWREDASNTDPAMQRNRVRHELLPLLESKFNPRIREVLARTAGQLRIESECLAELAKTELTARIGPRQSLETNSPPHPAIWRRVLYNWLLKSARVEPARLDNALVLRVEQLAATGGAMTLPGNLALRADPETGLTFIRPRVSKARRAR